MRLQQIIRKSILVLALLMAGNVLCKDPPAAETINPYAPPGASGVSLTQGELWPKLVSLSEEFWNSSSAQVEAFLARFDATPEERNRLFPHLNTKLHFDFYESIKRELRADSDLAGGSQRLHADFLMTPPEAFASLEPIVRLTLFRFLPLEILSAYREKYGLDLASISANEDPTMGREVRRMLLHAESEKAIECWEKNHFRLGSILPNTWTSAIGAGAGMSYVGLLSHTEIGRAFVEFDPRLVVLAAMAIFVSPTLGKAIVTNWLGAQRGEAALQAINEIVGNNSLEDTDVLLLAKNLTAGKLMPRGAICREILQRSDKISQRPSQP